MPAPTTNHDWLRLTVEEPLDPELADLRPAPPPVGPGDAAGSPPAICSTRSWRTSRSGHNVVSTVFIECGAMYRRDAPEALRPVGETEFVNGIAAMSASGLYGPARVAAGIVGTADLRLGKAVGDVLDAQIAAGGGRFRGIRRSAAWDADEAVPKHRTAPPPGLFAREDFRAGFAELAPRGLTFEAWCYHRQIPEVTALARAFPEHDDHPQSLRRAHRRRVLRRPGPRGIRRVAHRHQRARRLSQRRGQARRDQHGGQRLRLARAAPAAVKPGAGGRDPGLLRVHHREIRRRPVHVRVELPRGRGECSYTVLWNSFKRLTAGCSAGDKAKLFHDTAARVYRLSS